MSGPNFVKIVESLQSKCTLWQFDSLTVWKADVLTVWKSDTLALWQSDSMTVWQSETQPDAYYLNMHAVSDVQETI